MDKPVTLVRTQSCDLVLPPMASYSYSPQDPLVNQTIKFNASSSYDSEGIVSWSWDFDDGNETTTTIPLIAHTYTSSGNYNVTLKLTNSEGLTSTASQQVTVDSVSSLNVPDDYLTPKPTVNASSEGEVKNTPTTSEDENGLPLFEFGLILFFVILFIVFVLINPKDREREESRKRLEEARRRSRKIDERINRRIQERVSKERAKLREERKYEEEMRAKGYVKYRGKWGTPEQVKKWKEVDVGLDNNFANLTPQQFEKFVGELFRKMGYNVDVTSGSGDYGADIVAKKGDETIIVEVKKYSQGNLVTPKEVRGTLGAMWKYKADKAVFITTSDFTVRAKEIEKESPIELWNKRILHQMVRKYFIEK